MAYRERLIMLAKVGVASASGAKNIDVKPTDNAIIKIM
jgi:hypothetical protein